MKPYLFRVTSKAQASILLIRILVGSVFLSEGLQKFLYADKLGVGRFEKIGLPSPEILGPLVGVMEILCGALVLLGLATRAAVVPLMIIMLVALASTKWPIFLSDGFFAAAHAARADWAMLLCSLFLFINGAGPLSMDARISKAEEKAILQETTSE